MALGGWGDEEEREVKGEDHEVRNIKENGREGGKRENGWRRRNL